MVVLITESVSTSLRGTLTRWMIEPKAGVFVGRLSATVREHLWQRACRETKDGGCILIWSSDTEQGFRVDFWGKTTRWMTDWEGLQLVTKPQNP